MALQIFLDSSQEIPDTDATNRSDTDTTCSITSLSQTLVEEPLVEERPRWSCTPLHDIHFGPSTYPVLQPLKASVSHCVTFRTDLLKPGVCPTPYPGTFRDIWDSNHIKMPCSSQSLYPKGSGQGSSALGLKWDMVQRALALPIQDSFHLEKAILSYNSRFAGKWKFGALHSYCTNFLSVEECNKFFNITLPKMMDLALQLPTLVTHAIPLLRKQQDYSITLTQQQIACLLANAFFCTYPRRNTTGATVEYARFPSINFNTLFSGAASNNNKLNKLQCLCHYFERITRSTPTGTVTFTRQVLSSPPDWGSMSRFTKLHVTADGTIEDCGYGMLQVDFANKYVGGGVLGQGCVQEEIRFLICPELIVSRLFTEELDSNECLVVTGMEQFSRYNGYASTFEWAGDFVDSTARDNWGQRQVQLVALDALIFHGIHTQFKPENIQRELNKAYCGFTNSKKASSGHSMAVATGNWGCGAFGGDPYLKALLQWMAASLAQRDIVYFTFGREDLVEELEELHCVVTDNGCTVGTLLHCLTNYHSDVVEKRKQTKLIEYLRTFISQPFKT